MLVELAVATLMVLLTVIIHGAGLAVLGRILRLELKDEGHRHVPQLSARSLAFTLALVLGLFALHGLEIWLYAILYVALGAVQGLEKGVYFSTTTYGTIGFSDIDMAARWRLVGAIEGVNGILLLGWSTAFFVTVVTRLGARP